ncbi:uncharacterized protein LOC118751804 [Rhagoletis pomonella]|uniref:uncharacterized protein LOC118751804 n=1 Tax=Rhagoletis pomonella TaxID=28610 RepID=UPI00177E1AAE|nr:uncharacterized protein LOC118751804 [Rhagoletis pomonella]
MNSNICNTSEEEMNDNGETASSTTSGTKSATSCKSRLRQKLSWIPSPEKETYRTVLVNYRYAKMDKNYPRNTGAVSKKKHWNRMVAAMSAEQNNEEEEDYDEDEDAPNLRNLYACSKEDLDFHKTPNTPVPSYENIHTLQKKRAKEAIKLEVLCLPVEQEATVEDPQLNTIDESEVESATLRTDDNHEEDVRSQEYSDERVLELTDNSTDTTRMAVLYSSCTDCLLLGDNEIGETPDFDADFCCAMTKDKVDGIQQTCIIRNTTKATQSPERHNERLQTKRRSSLRATTAAGPQNDENCLQLTVAEIPNDSDKSKSTPTQGGFRQRQQELHRYRIAVEQKRLELLEMKLQRERDEMLREQILFEKELEFKATQLSQLNDDKTVDIL